MKKMNIFNTLRHFLNVLLLLLLLVGVNTTAWGKEWKWEITVGVSDGRGTVYADIDKQVAVWYDEKDSEDATYGNPKKVTVTTDHRYAWQNSNRKGHVYVKSADPGYSFLAWYDENGNQLSTSETYEAFGACNDGAIRKCYAKFAPVKVNSAGTASTISIKSPGTMTSTLYFPVSENADSNDDFKGATVTGDGWSVSSLNLNTSTHKVEVICSYTATTTTSQGDHEATVTLTAKSNESNTGKVKANVDLTPTLTVSPISLDFGMFTVNVDSKKNKTVALTYNVNATNFTLTDNASLAPFYATRNGSTVTVYYEPTSVGTGTWSKTLTVTAKNSQSPQLSVSKTITLTGKAQAITNPKYTCNIADNYMVDAPALDLQSLWTSTSNGTITYSIVSFTPSSSNNIGATAPAITNNRLSLGQAGTLKLKLTQVSATNFYAGEDTKTITIHKYNSAFAGVADLSTNVDADVESAYTLNYSKPDAAYIGEIPTAGTPTEGVSSTGFYYTLDHKVTTTNTENSANGSLAITYTAGNKTATGKNAGTGTILLRQPERFGFYDRSFYGYGSRLRVRQYVVYTDQSRNG